jgi:hypothetical protein
MGAVLLNMRLNIYGSCCSMDAFHMKLNEEERHPHDDSPGAANAEPLPITEYTCNNAHVRVVTYLGCSEA